MPDIGFLMVIFQFILNEKEIDALSLIELLKTTKDNNSNSLISFKDNSSVIKGTSEIIIQSFR